MAMRGLQFTSKKISSSRSNEEHSLNCQNPVLAPHPNSFHRHSSLHKTTTCAAVADTVILALSQQKFSTMAFVSALPLSSRRRAPLSRSALTGVAINNSPSPIITGPRMGYGDYSYLTDKSKSHSGQYYAASVSTFGRLGKGSPTVDPNALDGRNTKGGVLVPKEGIPQEIDPILLSEEAMVDPRVAESEGTVYSWDATYMSKYGRGNASDLDDETVVDDAFAKFRDSLSEERDKKLSAMDCGAEARVEMIRKGLDEKYMLCFEGALEAAYARLQKISDPVFLTSSGEPQTDIPGFPYMKSVGAMDFQ